MNDGCVSIEGREWLASDYKALRKEFGIGGGFFLDDFPPYLRIEDIGIEEVGRVVRVKGIVSGVEFVRFKMKNVGMKCMECGKVLENTKKCGFCKSKNVRIRNGGLTVKFSQIIEISNPYSSSSLRVIVNKSQIGRIEIGKCIALCGIVRLGEDETVEIFIKSLGLIYIRCLDSIHLSCDDAPIIDSLIRNPDLVFSMVYSLFPNKSVPNLLKYIVLLVLFSSPKNSLSVLITISPGENLSSFLEFISKISPHCVLVSDRNGDYHGMLGLKENKNGTIGGALCRANGGVLIIDDPLVIKNEATAIIECIERKQAQSSYGQDYCTHASIIVISSNPNDIISSVYKKSFTFHIDAKSSLSPSFNLALFNISPFTSPCSLKNRAAAPLNIIDHMDYIDNSNPIDVKTMRKLISYSRLFINNEVDSKLITVINDLKMEGKYPFISILDNKERIIYISASIARSRFRSHITEIEIQESLNLLSLLYQNTNNQNKTVFTTLSRKRIIEQYINELMLESSKNQGFFLVNELRNIANRCRINTKFNSFEQFLNLLNSDGTLLLCRGNMYKLKL